MYSQKSGARTIAGILYGITVFALFLFLMWKCRFGFANFDESFYLTIPYRLCRGDALITQEWHLSQLSGFLLYPIMRIYLLIIGGTEGMMINFRYIYTIIWTVSAVFLFYRLKSFSLYGAMFASVFYMIYVPFGIMALSYNSMGIMFLLLACVVAVTAEKRIMLQYGMAGILFASAVLCCPYLIILYILFTAAAIFLRKKVKNIFRVWLMMSVGSAALLVVFCLFLFSRASLSELIAVFPELFRDPEHAGLGLGDKICIYVESIFFCNSAFPVCLPLAVLVMIVTKIAADVPSGRKGRDGLLSVGGRDGLLSVGGRDGLLTVGGRDGLLSVGGRDGLLSVGGRDGLLSADGRNVSVGLIVLCILAAIIQISFLLEKPYPNYAMFPINLPGIYCAIHSRRKEIRVPFWGIWMPGAVYTFCICLSSNQKFYAVSSAATVMTVASVIMLAEFVRGCGPQSGFTAGGRNLFGNEADPKEVNNNSGSIFLRIAYAAIVLTFVLQFSAELYLRYEQVFWEPEGVRAQTELAVSGPDKGIYMTRERLDTYERHNKDMEIIREDPEISSLMVLSKATYLYLCAEKDVAAYSAWTSGMKPASVDRLDRYYEMRPEKIPDAIYIEKQYWKYADRYLKRGYRSERLRSGAYLLKR